MLHHCSSSAISRTFVLLISFNVMTACPISGNPLIDTSILDPHAYATAEQMSSDKAAYLFQCAQRSHVTYLEHQPLVLTTLLISGLKFPLLASGSALIWCAGRIIYARGYVDPAKEQGKGRLRGTFGYLGELSLLALSALTAGMVVMGY